MARKKQGAETPTTPEILNAEPDDGLPFQFESGEEIVGTQPPMDSPEWSDWVMTQFSQEELNNGLPNVAGLRRVAQMLLGPIVRSVGKPVTVLADSCVSVYEVDFLWMRDDERKGRIVTYGDTGSCTPENCDNPNVAKFKPEVSTTRGEARCLRKALQLKAIAAEEQIGAVQPSSDNISLQQILFIDVKCRDLKVGVKEFVNAGRFKYKFINDVKYDAAVSMTEAIAEYEREGLPKILQGKPYDPNWRDGFCR